MSFRSSRTEHDLFDSPSLSFDRSGSGSYSLDNDGGYGGYGCPSLTTGEGFENSAGMHHAKRGDFSMDGSTEPASNDKRFGDVQSGKSVFSYDAIVDHPLPFPCEAVSDGNHLNHPDVFRIKTQKSESVDGVHLTEHGSPIRVAKQDPDAPRRQIPPGDAHPSLSDIGNNNNAVGGAPNAANDADSRALIPYGSIPSASGTDDHHNNLDSHAGGALDESGLGYTGKHLPQNVMQSSQSTMHIQDGARLVTQPQPVMRCLTCRKLHWDWSSGRECYYSHFRMYRCYDKTCRLRFGNEHEVIAHFKDCHPGVQPQVYCPTCGQDTNSLEEYQRHHDLHVRAANTVNVHFVCPYCKDAVIDREYYLRHLSSHTVVTLQSIHFPDTVPNSELTPEMRAMRAEQQRQQRVTGKRRRNSTASSDFSNKDQEYNQNRSETSDYLREPKPQPSGGKTNPTSWSPSEPHVKLEPLSNMDNCTNAFADNRLGDPPPPPEDAVVRYDMMSSSSETLLSSGEVPGYNAYSNFSMDSMNAEEMPPLPPPPLMVDPNLFDLPHVEVVRDDDDGQMPPSNHLSLGPRSYSASAPSSHHHHHRDHHLHRRHSTSSHFNYDHGVDVDNDDDNDNENEHSHSDDDSRRPTKKRKHEPKRILCTACDKMLARKSWAHYHANNCEKYEEGRQKGEPHRISVFKSHEAAIRFSKRLQDCRRKFKDATSRLREMSALLHSLPPNKFLSDPEKEERQLRARHSFPSHPLQSRPQPHPHQQLMQSPYYATGRYAAP